MEIYYLFDLFIIKAELKIHLAAFKFQAYNLIIAGLSWGVIVTPVSL